MKKSEIPAIEQLARLAHLRIDPDEAEALRNRLERVLDHFKTLQTIDTEGVEASPYAVEITTPLRPDVEPSPAPADGRRIVADQAPASEGDEYRVPPIL